MLGQKDPKALEVEGALWELKVQEVVGALHLWEEVVAPHSCHEMVVEVEPPWEVQEGVVVEMVVQ